MNIRRILISEQDKKSILGLYGVDTTLVNEQFNPTDGTYTTQFDQVLNSVTNNGISVKIPKGTKVYHDFNGTSTKVILGNTGVYYDCAFTGYENIFTVSKTLGTVKNDSLSKMIRGIFCNGKAMKTWEETTGKKEQTKDVQKPLIQKKCYTTNFTPTGNQICKLPNDKVWVYAKDGDGKWYTSRQTDVKKWCELVLPQYQVAVDKLIAGCPTTEPIVLNVKPIEQVQTKTPELQVTPKQQVQQNLNTATQGLNYLQSQKNKPV